MKRYITLSSWVAVCITATVLAGCGASQPAGESVSEENLMPPSDEVHSHASEGPHHGTLIELGNEEYHAELLHDDKSITCYILDATATKPVAIESANIALNVVRAGKAEQLKLLAKPDAGDAEGKSSRFQIEGSESASVIDQEGVNARLSLTIAGTAYVGEVKHDHSSHDHSSHNHETQAP